MGQTVFTIGYKGQAFSRYAAGFGNSNNDPPARIDRAIGKSWYSLNHEKSPRSIAGLAPVWWTVEGLWSWYQV